ncbi:unnamed protein product [Penicillium salamii]|nr:unnamed protein product [Penicillium salamii]
MPMMMGRPYPDYDPRMGGGPQRHHSISEFDGNRAPPSGNAQGFYASQRYQGRPNEVEQMMQAKRRMAAQRERELRNYHQEQQYNRSTWPPRRNVRFQVRPLHQPCGRERGQPPRPPRPPAPRPVRQRKPCLLPPGALDESSRPASQAASTPGVRGSSPRGVDPFGLAGSAEARAPSRANSTSSPSSAINAGFEQPVTSPSPATDPSRQPTGSVGPIGSRVQQTPPNPALNKRSITPLPSPLGLGFTPADPAPERTSSAGPAPVVPAPGPKDPAGVGLGWSNGSGVWGSKSGLGVQASVWG